MLRGLTIKNFKCFECLPLSFKRLTLMTGLNAAGKSSAIQGLLLLVQALQSGSEDPRIPLNGRLVHLGTAGEVLHSGDGNLTFEVQNDKSTIEWLLKPEDRACGNTMRIEEVGVSGERYREFIALKKMLPAQAPEVAIELLNDLGATQYLSALRIGAPDIFPVPEVVSGLQVDVGSMGEFAPWYFHQFLDEEIDEKRCHSSDISRTLRRQLNAWASTIFPGAQANTELISKANAVRLELRIGDIGDWRRPSNIGYGLVYAFPILVAGLLAKPGQILIVDSPEAHLHPSGQSSMGKFLATVAAAGVQLIVETHSDHTLNGIRRAIGEDDVFLDAEDATVYFFDAEKTLPIELNFLERGSIDSWPAGFFDQYQLDVMALTKIRRSK